MQPADRSASLGATVTFRVTVTGYTAPLAHQWHFQGAAIDPVKNRSAASSILNITNVQVADAGGYFAIVTDSTPTSVTSRVAQLTVDPTFTKIMTGAIVTDTVAGDAWRPPAWADYDGDGDLDVVMVTDKPGFLPLYRNNGDGTFTRLLIPSLQGGNTDAKVYSAWGDYDNDGYPDLFIADASEFLGASGNNFLFYNDGNGTFSRILTSERARFVSPVWVDLDDDGLPDVFMTEASTNRLYRNLGDGTFSKVPQGAFVPEQRHYWYSSAWADYDNDGRVEAILTQVADDTRTLGPLTVYRSEGAFQFTQLTTNDVGPLAAERVYSWSAAWGDYDNDGWLDLFVANGYLDTENDRPCLLYRNNGNGTFTKIVTGSPVNDTVGLPYADWVDYDKDGFLDLFQGCRDGAVPHRLYRNNGNSNAWLCVTCEGTASPRSGTGAKVRVKVTIRGQSLWQLRLIDAGGCGSSFVAHFGLGDATVVDTLRIEWTSGIVQELHNVAARQYLTATEPARLAMLRAGELQIQCWQGMAYRIDGSLDLLNWTPLTTVTNLDLTGGIQWSDPEAPGQQVHFYRAVKQ